MGFFKKTNKADAKFSSKSSRKDLVINPKPTTIIQPITLGYIDNVMDERKFTAEEAQELSEILRKIPKAQRRQMFGENRLPEAPMPSFFKIAINASKDKVLFLLMISSIFSIAVGLYDATTSSSSSSSSADPSQPPPWMEGLGIGAAVILVILVNSINDYRREMQFRSLSLQSEERMIIVEDDNSINNSTKKEVSVHSLVVGDVVHIGPGDIVAADGIILPGQSVCLTDCSSFTGETRSVPKGPKADPYLLEGTKIMKGCSKFLVLQVGSRTMYGKMILGMRGYVFGGIVGGSVCGSNINSGSYSYSNSNSISNINSDDNNNNNTINNNNTKITNNATSSTAASTQQPQTPLVQEQERTPLQNKLDSLAEVIAKIGMLSSLILFTVLLAFKAINWWNTSSVDGSRHILRDVVDVVMEAITVVVVAVPEGLPMAVTLALAWASSQMSKDSCLVRVLCSCEVMGGVTSICSDKTGTLTENKMTVTSVLIPGMAVVDCSKVLSALPSSQSSKPQSASKPEPRPQSTPPSFIPSIIQEGILTNTTSFWDEEKKEWIGGGGTEVALLRFIQAETCKKDKKIKQIYRIDFDSALKYMATTISSDELGATTRTHWKGASEIIIQCCSKIRMSDGSIKGIDKEMWAKIVAFQNQQSANGGLRLVAMAYKDSSMHRLEVGMAAAAEATEEKRPKPKGLTLLCLLAIEDPLRQGVREAVAKVKKAGVMVRMLTGDSEETARAIARKAGILTSENGLVLNGETFRSLPPARLRSILPRLEVLARCTPEDKRILVKALKVECQEVVAVTGDGTNDGPAMREGDVSFSMGKCGTEVAKEASSIILLQDDFSSILTALLWGRGVTENVRKFLQFQLTVNVSAVLTCFISAALLEGKTILSPLQLLWVNLIMDALGALALATDPPNEDVLLSRAPEPRSSPLIKWSMIKAILVQSIYQLSIMTMIILKGLKTKMPSPLLRSLSFNVFVMLQLFNEFNCRFLANDARKERESSLGNLLLLPLRGLGDNMIFCWIWISCFVVQFLLVEFCANFMGTVGLSLKLWIASILIGFSSIIVGFVVRLLPGDDNGSGSGSGGVGDERLALI